MSVRDAPDPDASSVAHLLDPVTVGIDPADLLPATLMEIKTNALGETRLVFDVPPSHRAVLASLWPLSGRMLRLLVVRA